ncbi:hypothetical protein QT381_04100 [Galbitalea sp. SE-J8]|uniref:hypothetical protein n=1 Tax=Galbitalea sp. SE-J8 TaxID=3054952 RepID=UPI00259C6DEC|nr:hypothetical protein [Galbitalea sp. SE-J8]MDM4762186.1 hypothetical protein [Galbitalea sp. SE-J8]
MSDLLPDDADFAALGERMLTRTRRDDRRRRRAMIAGAGAAAVIAVGAATGWAVLASTEARRDLTYCYGAADLQAERVEVGTPEGAPHDPDVAAQAIAKCEAAWRVGALSSDGVTPQDPPALQPCVAPDGVIAVFPRVAGDACKEVGLDAAG